MSKIQIDNNYFDAFNEILVHSNQGTKEEGEFSIQVELSINNRMEQFLFINYLEINIQPLTIFLDDIYIG